MNIVFAAFGVFGLIFFMVLFHLPADSDNPVVKLIHENPAYAAWLKASILLEVPSCLVLLVTGVGLLCLKSWARILSIACAIYAMVFGISGMVVNFVFMVLPIAEQARQQQGLEAAAAVGGAVGETFGGCFDLIYPVLLLIFMTRPKVAMPFRPPVPPRT